MKRCSVEGCSRPKFRRNLCTAHYYRLLRKGTTDPTPQKTCSITGCTRPHLAKGLCASHYITKHRRGGIPKANPKTLDAPPPPRCTAWDCARLAKQNGLCHLHLEQQASTRSPAVSSTEEAASIQALFLAVIERALGDATAKPYSVSRISDQAKAQARRWLTTYSPDLEEVCDLAGVTPSYLIAHARLLIHNHDRVARMANAFRTPSTSPPDPGGTSQLSNTQRGPARGPEKHISKIIEIETRH